MTSNSYSRPWSTVDSEEIRLLREIAALNVTYFQFGSDGRILNGPIPDELHKKIDQLKILMGIV